MSGTDATPPVPMWTGISLRDYFAGQAIVGMLASRPYDAEAIAYQAYRQADAMLAARRPAPPAEEPAP